jgi:hypothetical protein
MNKVFKLMIFVLLEVPILLLLLGNIHNAPLFGFFMSTTFSGALTDTGDNFYTPTNLINDFIVVQCILFNHFSFNSSKVDTFKIWQEDRRSFKEVLMINKLKASSKDAQKTYGRR